MQKASEKRLKLRASNFFENGERTLETAFVFINVLPGMEKEVLRSLRQIKGVTESYELYGDYDILAKVESEEKERLQAIIQEQIRCVKGIANTSTNFVFDSNAPYL